MTKKMSTVTNRGDRLDQLKNLSKVLARAIDECEDQKVLAQLARQYRETIREVEEIEGVTTDDEISAIISARESAGKPGAVRKNRA